MTAVERFDRGCTVRRDDELAALRAERDLWWARLRQAEAERDGLRAQLAKALDQVEYWRTLADYRESRLVERQAGTDSGRPRDHGNVRD